MTESSRPMAERLRQISLIFLLLFGAVALALAYWGVIRSPALLAREDNPRLVEAELRVQRGRILDNDGVVLAQTVGEPGDLERQYAEPYSPAVGYYSLRYGLAGLEETYDQVLRGQAATAGEAWLDDLLHRPQIGWDVETTLDATLQAAASQALGDQTGAVVAIDVGTGDVLALVSHPTFDPNQLDEQFEVLNQDDRAPLLNRAAQGLYQPGAALEPFVLGAALENDLAQVNQVVDDPTRPVQAGEVWVSCLATPPDDGVTLGESLAYACPAPFVTLADQLGSDRFWDGLSGVGFFQSLDLPMASAESTRPEGEQDGDELAAEVVGQGEMTVSPVQMAWALSTIAGEGVRQPLRMVRRIGTASGGWELVVPGNKTITSTLSAETAAAITEAMVAEAREGATPVSVPGLTIAAHSGLATAGPEGTQHAWFMGFAPADASQAGTRLAVVVLLEESNDLEAAAAVGQAVLQFGAGG